MSLSVEPQEILRSAATPARGNFPLDSRPTPGRGLHVIVDGIVYGLQKHGGINTYFNEILIRLAWRRDLAITVLLPHQCHGELPSLPIQLLREPLPAVTGWSWRLDQFLGPLFQRANGLVRKLRLQTVHARARWPCVFQSTYFTLGSAALPQVAIAHDMNHELFPEKYQSEWGSWLRRQYREYISHATRIIAVSHNTKKDIVRFYGVPPTRIDVVHHAVNRDAFWPQRSARILSELRAHIGCCQPYVLYVGTRGGYKNFSQLLEGFAQSCVRNKLYLVVAGKPWHEGEREQLARLGLESRVRLVVNPAAALLRALYSCAAAFIYPSLHEGFGIPLLEAMACGTLVLASDIAVFREVAGEAAVYFNPTNPADLAGVLETPFAESLREQTIARGFEQVANYSWDKCADQTLCVYQKAAADL